MECFEYNYDDLRKNSLLRDKCCEHGLADYDKGSKDIFKIVSAYIDIARKRAKQLNINTQNSADSAATQPYQFNPYTDVHKLLDKIDKFGGKKP